MKDYEIVHKKQQTLYSSLAVLGAKVDEVSNTAQQLVDDKHYASADIIPNVTSLRQRYLRAYVHIYVCTYIHIHTYIHAYIHTYVRTYVWMYICMYVIILIIVVL